MEWKVHSFDRRAGQDGVSRSHSTSEGALRNACDLMRQNCRVDYITGPSNTSPTSCPLGWSTHPDGKYEPSWLWCHVPLLAPVPCRRQPVRSICRTRSLPQRSRGVLRAELKFSEIVARAAH